MNLQNKIDFAVIVNVENANPNGDPLNGNRPRTNYDGFGELSDVCIKRKIRNRWMDEGYSVFVQSDDKRLDDYRSLKARVEGMLTNTERANDIEYRKHACEKWIDVRAFGQVFAYTGTGNTAGVSVGIRGPVSIHPAFSVASVADRITSTQITKSVSGEGDGTRRGSDTMGLKHRVDHGIYLVFGSINPQLAELTGFSDEDAEAIKTSLISLFENDASSARPEGSMEVYRVYWWKHDSKSGQYSSAKVHRAIRELVKVKVPDALTYDVDDYIIPSKEDMESILPGLSCEVIEGM